MKHYLWNLIANIKNGAKAKKPFIYQRKTFYCVKFLDVLWDEGFILGYKNVSSQKLLIKIFLKYTNGKSSIKVIKSISKPGFRVNLTLKEIWKIKINSGILIISTNKGILSNNFCKKKKIRRRTFVLC